MVCAIATPAADRPEGRISRGAVLSMVSADTLRVGVKRSPKGRSGGLGLKSPHAVVGLLCAGLIVVGLLPGTDLDLSPSDGLGYALGIIGLAAMTLLLGYSIRKRMKLLRNAGPMRSWFEIHLVLGLLGPTAILYHSGFELGSTNSTISLMCVLAVSGSGVGGRFLYGRMHRSLAGPRRTTHAYQRHASGELKAIESVLEKAPRARDRLQAFADLVQKDASLSVLPIRILGLRPHAWQTKRAVFREIKKSARPHVVSAVTREAISSYFSDLCRGFELRLFEKLFALWHAIHVPLTVILFISAAIHVVAVHVF